MSLFTVREICEGCKFAAFHPCGNCLFQCGADAQCNRDYLRGKCSSREEGPPDPPPESDSMGWDDMREGPAQEGHGDTGRPYMENG